MSSLCRNRVEGFAFQSRIISNITTSCFNDVVLVPLTTCVYLLLLPIIYATQPRITTFLYTGKVKRPHHTLKITLYALVLTSAFAMTVLEITRLALADLGIGLLTVQWGGFILAAALRFSHGIGGRFPRYWVGSVLFWVLLIATDAVRLVEMVKEGVVFGGRGTAYPIVDQVVDVGVCVGIYFWLAILELWR